LTRPPHLTIAQLWQRWLNNSLLDEFSRVEEIKGQRAANVLTAAKPRRKFVGQALAGLTPGAWISVDSLFTDMPRRPPHRARFVEAAPGGSSVRELRLRRSPWLVPSPGPLRKAALTLGYPLA
jgi:hypothetical protein